MFSPRIVSGEQEVEEPDAGLRFDPAPRAIAQFLVIVVATVQVAFLERLRKRVERLDPLARLRPIRIRLPSECALAGCQADAVAMSAPASIRPTSSGRRSGGYVQSLSIVHTMGARAYVKPVRSAAPSPQLVGCRASRHHE